MQEGIKGLVMKVDPPFVVVMTREGHFVKERLPGVFPQVGEEVFLPCREKPFWKRKISLAAVAAVLIFILLPFSILPAVLTGGKKAEICWVTLDINPSLEYGLDQDLRVIRINSLNAEAQRLVDGQEILHQPIGEVIPLTVRRATELGYINTSKENHILITVSPQDEREQEQDQQLPEELVEKANQALETTNMRASVNVLVVPAELRNQAQEFNISVGKYVVMLEGLQEGLSIEATQLQEKSIQSAVVSAGGDFRTLVKQVKEEKDLKTLENKIKDKLPAKEKKGKEEKKNKEQTEKKDQKPKKEAKPKKSNQKGKSDSKGKTDPEGKTGSDNERISSSLLKSILPRSQPSESREEKKKPKSESNGKEKNGDKNNGKQEKGQQEGKNENKKSQSSMKDRFRPPSFAPQDNPNPGKSNNKGGKP